MSAADAAPAATMAVRLYVLCPFRIEGPDGAVRLVTRKAESLLAYLAMYPQQHRREQLAAQFWGDSTDRQARQSLRVALASVRKQVGKDLVLADQESVQLNPHGSFWLDAAEFKRRATEFLSQDFPRFAHAPSDLYRDDLLVDWYDDWIMPVREEYRSLYLEVLLRMTELLRAQGEYGRAIETATTILRKENTNEQAHQHLMFCYLALGDRHAALDQYAECRRLLQSELGVGPSPETETLAQQIRQIRLGLSRPVENSNLPVPLTPLIGRRPEVDRIKQLIVGGEAASGRPPTRLMTLIGPGGCGKTRLAIQVGTELIQAFRHGVRWVDLAEVNDGTLVPRAVAKSLGVKSDDGERLDELVADRLRGQHLLLVVDNCEHLLPACRPLAAELLSRCPDLQILATSRERLGITGEVSWLVPSMALPDPQAPADLPSLLQWEGIRLFVERAVAVSRDFRLTEANAPAVVEIGRRLDGIPLALELAAARVNAMSVPQIAARLDDRFDLLTLGNHSALPRQQTLRATIDWSYDLLSPAEQTLFRQLAVFHGKWTLEAAEAVAQDPGFIRSDILNLLTRLVDKSLLTVEYRKEQIVYHMLDTLRTYALDKLKDSREEEDVRCRHLQYFLELAERAEPELTRAQQRTWRRRLESESANLRAALEWACDPSGLYVEQGLRLASALFYFWHSLALPSEGRDWLTSLLAAERENPAWVSPSTLAKALTTAGMLAYAQADYAQTDRYTDRALALARSMNDSPRVATILNVRGIAACERGDRARASAFLSECLSIRRGLEDERGVAVALNNLGETALGEGNFTLALSFLEEARGLYQRVGDWAALVSTLVNLSRVHLQLGDPATADRLAREGLASARELDFKRIMPSALEAIAAVCERRGQALRAATLFGAAHAAREAAGQPIPPADRAHYASEMAAVQAQLGETAFTRAQEEGRQMPLEQAIHQALER